MLYGVNAAIMQRATKSWLFKEVDSPMLGWEVYAEEGCFLQRDRHRARGRRHQERQTG